MFRQADGTAQPSRSKPGSRRRPKLAYALSFGSAAVNFFLGAVFLLSSAHANEVLGLSSEINGVILDYGVITVVCALGITFGALYQRTGVRRKVRMGSAVVVALNLVTVFSSAGGFIVGFVFGVAGAVLGFVWRPAPPES